MKKIAYAICDTDGGRLKKPIILLRHIYSTEKEAIQARNYSFDKKYYPIHTVLVVTTIDFNKQRIYKKKKRIRIRKNDRS